MLMGSANARSNGNINASKTESSVSFLPLLLSYTYSLGVPLGHITGKELYEYLDTLRIGS